MRFTTGLFVLLALVATASAHFQPYQCGPNRCNLYHSCIYDCNTFVHGCFDNCEHVTLQQRMDHSWVENGVTYVQVEGTLINNGPRSVKNVIIGTDMTLNLKDGTISNLVRLGMFDLGLTTDELHSGQTYTFSYTNRDQAAHMYIKNVDLM
eukprot:gene7492-8765_t